METMQKELRDSFRLYDKEGQGSSPWRLFEGLISELLGPLSDEDLNGIVAELDEDGSGTMDFEEFCEMMMTSQH